MPISLSTLPYQLSSLGPSPTSKGLELVLLCGVKRAQASSQPQASSLGPRLEGSSSVAVSSLSCRLDWLELHRGIGAQATQPDPTRLFSNSNM
ncbi:hypothetical protein NL676_005393 [Syzygium grande]|nr:hypothetical protein NL676_005393 [Syzygium grande]